MAFNDLALQRDVDLAVASLPGTLVAGLAEIGEAGRAGGAGGAGGYGAASHDEDIAAVRRIVAEEVAAHASATHAARVTPTVVALRANPFAQSVGGDHAAIEGLWLLPAR